MKSEPAKAFEGLAGSDAQGMCRVRFTDHLARYPPSALLMPISQTARPSINPPAR